MKRIGMAVWFWLAAAMALMAQSAPPPKAAPAPPVIKCKNVDGKGCTYRQAQALSYAVFAGKTQHGSHFLRRHIEYFRNLANRHPGFKILEHRLDRHAGSSENPRATHLSGNAFHSRTL